MIPHPHPPRQKCTRPSPEQYGAGRGLHQQSSRLLRTPPVQTVGAALAVLECWTLMKLNLPVKIIDKMVHLSKVRYYVKNVKVPTSVSEHTGGGQLTSLCHTKLRLRQNLRLRNPSTSVTKVMETGIFHTVTQNIGSYQIHVQHLLPVNNTHTYWHHRIWGSGGTSNATTRKIPPSGSMMTVTPRTSVDSYIPLFQIPLFYIHLIHGYDTTAPYYHFIDQDDAGVP